MIKSKYIFSPVDYISTVTKDEVCVLRTGATVSDIEKILNDFNLDLKNYALEEIDNILADNINVVLVLFTELNEDNELKPVYRWFELNRGFRAINSGYKEDKYPLVLKDNLPENIIKLVKVVEDQDGSMWTIYVGENGWFMDCYDIDPWYHSGGFNNSTIEENYKDALNYIEGPVEEIHFNREEE